MLGGSGLLAGLWGVGAAVARGFLEVEEVVDDSGEAFPGSGGELFDGSGHDSCFPAHRFGLVVAEEVAGGDVEELGEGAQGGGFGADPGRSQEVADAFGGDAVSACGEFPGDGPLVTEKRSVTSLCFE